MTTFTAPSERGVRRRPTLRPVPTPSSLAFRVALPWLLGSLAMITCALIGEVPPWTLLLLAGCACWRLRTEHRGGSLPSMWVRTLVFVPVAFLLVRTYGSRPSATGMLAILIALISLKILELRSPRDFTIVALLSYFMVLSAFFYSQSLALSLYLVVAIAANVVALIRCHSGGRRDVWPALRLAAGLAAQSLPLVVLLFVVFPRVHGDFLRQFNGSAQGQTGMSDHLTPGSFSSLAQSNELAFRAKIGQGRIVPAGQLYWRGLVLEICEHAMSWRAFETGELPPETATPPPPGRIEQQITLVTQGERWLFALDRPVEVKGSSSVRATLYKNDVLRSNTAVINKAIYTAWSELTPGEPRDLLPRERKLYTHVPSDVSPRVLALAQGWRQQSPSDREIVRLGSRFFQTGGFTYSLTPGLLPRQDAIDHFLFISKQGFCEHYAAAFSTLMRAAGVPSRVVVGYQGGEYNHWGGHYTIRQSDSHAWSEVWIDGRWQRQDPTALVAPERVSYGAESYTAFLGEGAMTNEMRLDRLNALNAPGSLHWLFRNGLQAWDTVDQQWNTMVIGYDQDTQLTVMEKLGVGSLDWLGGTAATLAVAFFVLGLGALIMRPTGWRRSAPVDPARRLYERFCARLASAVGVRRAAAEGPLDFSRRAGEAAPAYAGDIERVTRLYVASRYAPPGVAGAATAELRGAVKGFRPARVRT